ncbi:MAG: exonuclease subunit SbcD [Myxococcota bacterium]|nr:exonuclease subunit SbcD [Myxococcota bacterium]
MRILHTSDWHLGVSMEQAPREEEHLRFLDWLIEQINERDVDILVHGGDTFHYVQPSARCLKIYYDFLARCGRETKLRQIIVTGGNHDSASRLDAPAPVLEALNVHVVGGLTGDEDTWSRCLCPIYTEAGDAVEAVVMAVPYMHESRLGVVTAGLKPMEIRDSMIDKFRGLYAKMADIAEEKYPDIPLITTGHLTCYPDGKTDVEGAYHTPIHLIEALGSLPPDIFDLRYSYVALGHVHQKIEIAGPNAWYPGSPIPTDVTESRTPRHILIVDVDPNKPRAHATVEEVEVPDWRPVFEMFGAPDDLFDRIKDLEWDQELRPYLYLDLHVEAPMPDGMMKLDEVLSSFDNGKRPRLVRFKETLVNPNNFGGVDPSALRSVPLNELTPTDVFEKMYLLKHGQPPTDEILTAFMSLLTDEQLEEMKERRGGTK